MEQPFNLDETTTAQLERIANTLFKTGYGEEFTPKIAEKLAAGIKEFVIAADHPLMFGKDELALQVVIGQTKKDPPSTVLKGIDAYLTKSIKIPPVVIQDQSGHVLLDVRNLDGRLANPPVMATMPPAMHEDFSNFQKKYKEEINKDMQFLMKAVPDVFNLLHAKYNPALGFAIPPEMTEQQGKIIADHYVHNMFSSYFNLTPLEIYGMLKNKLPVNKDLFKTSKADPAVTESNGQKQPSERFNAWIRVNFNERGQDGNYLIEFVKTRKEAKIWDALSKYNFLELNNDVGKISTIHHLKKAGLVELTNGNTVGEKKVLVGADPGYQMRIKIFKLSGDPIRYHNSYLKNPLEKKISEVVSLPKVAYRSDRRSNGAASPGEKAIDLPPAKSVVYVPGAQPVVENATKEHNADTYHRRNNQRNIAPGEKKMKK